MSISFHKKKKQLPVFFFFLINNSFNLLAINKFANQIISFYSSRRQGWGSIYKGEYQRSTKEFW